MSRYRKVEAKMWTDARFRALSPLPPSGASLWLFLLTGPQTGPIPGLFRAGRAAMAEELGWSLEAFDEAFQEVLNQGMAKADTEARLVWLPKALRHNKPESPNVVISWRAELALLPECDLKDEALIGIRAMLEEAGSSYVEAFDRVVGRSGSKPSPKPPAKPSPKPSPKPSLKAMANQEQEQEQEQETFKRAQSTSTEVGARSEDPSGKPEPTAIGAVGMALRRGGVDPTRINLQDPRLLALVSQGATPDEFEGLALEACDRGIGHPLAWIVATLQGRRRDAAAIDLPPPAAPAPEPTAWMADINAVIEMAKTLGVSLDCNATTLKERTIRAWWARRRRDEAAENPPTAQNGAGARKNPSSHPPITQPAIGHPAPAQGPSRGIPEAGRAAA